MRVGIETERSMIGNALEAMMTTTQAADIISGGLKVNALVSMLHC